MKTMHKQRLYKMLNERLAKHIADKEAIQKDFSETKSVFEKSDLWEISYLENIDIDKIFLVALKIEDPDVYKIAKEELYKDDKNFFNSLTAVQAKLYFTKVADFLNEYRSGNFQNARVEVVEGDKTKSRLMISMSEEEQKILLSNQDYEKAMSRFAGLFSLAIKTDFFSLISSQYACELHLFVQFIKENLRGYREKYNVSDFSSLPKNVLRELANEDRKKNSKYLEEHHLSDLTNDIVDLYECYKNDTGNKIIKLDKKIKKYASLIKRFDKVFTTGEIADYHSLINGLDEDVKVLLLQLVDYYNKEEYSTLEECYKKVASNNKFEYKSLLKKYGIEDETFVEKISEYPLEKIGKSLSRLADLGIKDTVVVEEFLKSGSFAAVDELSKYIKKGIINLNFIKSNPVIFDCSSDIYNNVVANIANITQREINPTYIVDNQSVLLIPNEVLKSNLDVICEYSLKNKLTKGADFSVLNDGGLAEKLDVIIELGYENLLSSNISIASYSMDDWKKLQVLRCMNFEVLEEDVLDVLRSKSFIVDQGEIDNYIFKALDTTENSKLNNIPSTFVSLNNPLEEYSVSNLAYSIGGVTVSRNKVKRNLGKLQYVDMDFESKLLLSILNNMSISYDEVNSIKKTIGVGVEK